jgi:hypothetical protein
MRGVWAAFWTELMTPETFAGQPYYALMNAVGHMALGKVVADAVFAASVQTLGIVPNLWAVWAGVTICYAVGIELWRQKWFGTDTVQDSSFVSLGAVLTPATLSVTPSGQWFRVDAWSGGYLFWLVCTGFALTAYVYPRMRQAYGDST